MVDAASGQGQPQGEEGAGREGEDEEYERALAVLSSLISGRQRKDGTMWAHAFDMMQCYLQRLDLDEQLGQLSVIHVAGTKGKGSTCAMVERMLREAGYRTGLFTSPHLIDVRERIRINGEPIDRATFLRNLWLCFDKLEEKASDDSGKPAYFRFLTLLCFKVFLELGVDVVILEVGLGGRLDATNCVRRPVVCGVSSLGFDHMEVLGHTLPEIAREKAGIFKPGVPAFTVPQREDAAETLRERAAAVGAPLQVVRPWECYSGSTAVMLGLAGEHQKLNAALAVALAGAWEGAAPRAATLQAERAAARAAAVREGRLPPEYAAGLQAASWPGRGQIVHDVVPQLAATSAQPQAGHMQQQQQQQQQQYGNSSLAAGKLQHAGLAQSLPRLSFFLDGAHTAESMATCAHWFADAISSQPWAAASVEPSAQQPSQQQGLVTQRVLLFNCMQERDPQNLLQPLTQALADRQVSIHHALFVPPDSTYMKLGSSVQPVNLNWQHSLRSVWEAATANRIGSASPRSSMAAAAPLTLPPLPAVATPTLDLPAAARVAHVGGTRSAVLPSLRATLDWLRLCVQEVPSLRMQVLVTGSLYLVGDLLKALQQQQQQQHSSTSNGTRTGSNGAANRAMAAPAMGWQAGSGSQVAARSASKT